MANRLLRQFRQTTDPFRTLGRSSVDLVTLGYGATRGLMFPLRSGAVLLKRRRLYLTPGPWWYCGMAALDATVIQNYEGFGHEANQAYEYTVVRAEGNGYVSNACAPRRVDFDGGGDRITPGLPTWPREMWAQPITASEYRVHWAYRPWGQSVVPTDFEVYHAGIGADPDYGSPLGTVAYDASQTQFEFATTAGAYSEGERWAFAVRARNANSVAELNTFTTDRVRASSTAPGRAEIESAT